MTYGGGETSLKYQLPSSYDLAVKFFKDLEEKDDSLNQSITKVFIEQAILHMVR